MYEDDFGGLTNRNALGSVEAHLKPIGTAAKPEAQNGGDAPLPLPRIDAIKPAPGDTPAPEGNLYPDEERKRVKDKYGENWGKMSWFDQQRALAHDRWFRDVDSGAIDTDTFLEGVFSDPEVERINKREQEFISALKNAMSQDVTRLSDDEAQGYYMDLVEADPRFGFKDDVDGKMLFGDEAQYGRANLKRLLSVYSGANPNGLYSREAQKWLESDEAQRIASAKEMRGVKDKVLGFFDTDAEIVASAEQKLMAKERAVQFATLMGGLSPAGQELVKEAIKADEMDERTLRFLDEDERDAAMAAFRVSKTDLDANWWLTQGAARFGETTASVARGTWRTLANIYLTTGGRNPVGSKQLAAYEKEQELQLKIEDAEKWKYKDNLTFAGDIAAGLMGTIPYMAAMSNPYTGTMATLGMANDARERMILSGVDQDTALAISLPVGIVEGWIEKIQWEGAFGGSLSEFALRRASLLGVMKQIGKSPAKYLGGKLLKSGKEAAIVSITEDVEEVLQQLTEDLGVSVGTGDFNVREIAEDCWDTAVESFPTTLGFGLMRASGVGPALHRKFSRKSVASDEFIDYAQSKVSAMNVMDDLANGRTMSGQNGTQKPVVTAKVDPNGPDLPGGTAQDAQEAASTPSAEQTGKETSPTQEAPQESQDALKERLLDDFRTRWHRIDDADGRIGMLQDSGLNTDQAAILDTFFRLEDDFLEDNPVYRYYDANGDLKNMISIENLPKMMKGIKKVSLNEDGSHTLDLQLDKDTVVTVKIERVDRSTLRKENEAQYEKEVRIHYEDEHGKGSWDKLDDDAKDVLLRDAAPGGFTRITVDDETMPYDAIVKLAAPRLRQDLGNGVVIKGDPGADIDEVGHEIFHAAVRIALKRGIITEEDIGKMRQAFGAEKAEGYLFDEEKAADEYGMYIVDEYWKDETIGSVFGKIRDFFRRIYNALTRKSGNEPAELNAANVFEAISRGDLRGISALSGITVNEESAAQEEAEAETPAEGSTRNNPTVTAEVKDAVTVEATVEEVPVENLSTKNDPDFDPELAEAAPALVNSEPGDGMPVVVGGGNVLSGSETVQAAKRAGKKSVKVKRVRKVKTAKKPAAKVVKPFDIFNPQESLAAMNPFARNKFLSVQRFCDIHEGSFPCLQYWLDNGHAMFGRPAKDAKINDYLDQLSMSDRLFLTGMRKGGTAWDELPSLIGLEDKTTEEICDQALQERAHYIAWKERGGLTPEAEEFLANGGTEEEWIAANTRDETAEAPVAQEEPTAEEMAELAELGYYSIRDAVALLNDLVEADFIFGGANGIMSANATDEMLPKTVRAPTGVVDNYGVPNATRHRAYLSDCLSRMGDAAHGANVDRGGQVSPATVRQIFTDFNSNAETAAIFEEVAKVADALKVEYFLDLSKDNKLGNEYAYQFGGSLYYHIDRLAPESDQFIADTILHEMIHGVTAYAIDLAHGDKDLPGVTVSDELKAAVKDLDALRARNRLWLHGEYGVKNEKEFLAELSSADFRRKLSERSEFRIVIERIIDAIRKMFNLAPIDRTDYAVQAVNVLDRFLTNYQEEKFAQYQERAWDLEFGARQDKAAMKKSVERTKDLVALHNMSEDAVKSTADLGGFAIPSIAIFKNTYGHNEFGEVSVLFGKETIDPRKNRLNRVYSHDAWTATFPAISNKIDQQAIERKNEELIATLDERLTQPLYCAIYYLRYDDGVRDSWDRATDAGDAYGRNDALKAAYLVSRGEKVEPVYKDKTYIRGGHQRVYMLHEDGLRSLYESPVGRKLIDIYLGPGAESTAKYEKIAPKLEQFFRDIIWKRDFAGKPDVEGYTQEDVVGHFFTGEDGLNLGEMVSIAEALVRLEDDIKGGKVGMQEIDEYKTRDAISGRVADNDPGFVAWLNEQYGNPILGKGVYNGAERFTRMGNPRSWDALHDPATLENIVRAMKKTQKEKGNGIFGSNPFGVAARTLRSMQDIFATENILKELTPEEEKAIKAELSSRLSDIVGRYGKTQKSPDENPFIAADRAADMMFDAYQKYGQSIAGLKRELNGWGYSADDQLVQDFADLMAAIEMMPTNYFEAKPQRPVRFDEPKAWIVPHDAKPETLKTLRGNGQRIYTYRRGDNADRLRVVNEAANDTDALFSVRNPGGAQKRSDIAYPDATPEISNIPDGLFSIGNRKREEFKNLIVRKRPDFKDPDRAVEEIGKFATPKEQKAALKWLIGGRLILPEDAPKVTEAIRYAEKAKKDPLQYDGPVELMNALAEFKPKDKPIDPDTVPQLSDKRVLPDGVVTYAVQDDRAGQQAMREIVNTHWGKNANPWCLLHGDGEGNLSDGSDGGYNAWEYWNHYNALPKRVAFRNGKLLAFMATDEIEREQYGSPDNRLVTAYPEEYKAYNAWMETDEGQEESPSFFEYLEHEDIDIVPPEQWWDRNDEDHPGIPLGNQAVPNDPLGRFADFIIDKDGKRQIEGGYHKNDENVEIYWDSDGGINEYRDKKTDFRARYTFGDVESVVFRDGFEFHTSSAQFFGDGSDRIKELVIGGTVVFSEDGSFYYTAGFSSSYTFLNFKPDFTLDTSKDNAFDEVVGTDGKMVTTEIAAERLSKAIRKSVEQAKAAYQEALAVRDRYTVPVLASPTAVTPSEGQADAFSVRFDRKDPTDIIAGIVAMKTRKGEKMTINAVQKLLASVGADPSVGADLILRGQKSANRIENIVKGKALDDDTFLELATDESKKSRLLSFGEKMGMEGYKLGAADEQNLAALNEAKAAAVTAAMESAAGFSANAMELKYGFNLVDSVKNAHHAQVIKARKPQGKQDQPGEVNGEGITLTEMVAQEEANAAKPEQVAAPESAAMKELKAKAAKRADKIDAKFGLTGLNGMSPAQVADAKYQEQLDEYRRQHPEESAGGGEGEGAPVKKSQVKREQLDFNRASDFIAFVEEVVARESGKDGLFVKKNGAYQCSPLDVRNLANTAKFFLKKVASRLLYSKDRELIMRDLDELHKATTLRGVESAVMNLYTRIQDRLIPESQEQLIHKLEWAGKQLAEQGPVLSRGGDERDRKVRAKVEEWWRMVKAYLRFKPEEVEEEKNRIDKIIENREDVAAKDKAAGGADFIEQDLKYRQAIALKNALTQYGGLINRTPGEIADKSEEILGQLRGSRLELENAREDEYIRTRTISSHLQQAVINPKAIKDNKKPNPNWFVRMMDSMMGILYLRLRDLIRYSHGDVRRRAESDLRDIEDAVALGSQDFNVYLVTHQRKFDEAMKHIYGSSEKGVIRLTEPLDDADRKVITKQGIKQMTRSWLLQRFVELQQTDDYAQNIAVNKRDSKWREDFDRIFKKYISEEDMTFLMWMRNWYRENLAELNEKVLVPITGIKQYSPGENYFPVKMLPPPRLGVDAQAKAWSPLPSWLTPRVSNNYDFDERKDLLTMWYNRMRESGASIAYARLGLNLSDILLNPAMKEAVSRNHGDVALTRLQEHIRDIISGGARPIDESDDSLALADRLRAWQTNFTLSGNYISSLKQTTSCPTFALRHDIDFKMVFNFMMDVDFGSVKELMASDGWKSRYGNGLSEAMQNAMRVNSSISTGRAAKAVNLLHRVYNSGFKVMEVGDAFPCLWVGQGLYRYFLAQIRDQEGGSAVMSEEEMKRKALTRTWAVIETNQQSKRTENLTAAQRGGPLGRFLYQFVSSPVQQMAFEVQAIREALAARGTDHQAEAYRHLGRVLVINHILTPGLLRVAAIVGGLPLGQIPNRDDLYWDFIIQMLMGQYGCIFLAGQIGEGTLRALTTGKFDYRSQGLPVEGIADLFQKLGVTGFDLVTWRYEELLDDLLGVMKSTGAPTRHISNAIDNWGRGKIERNLRTWR